MSSNTNSSRSGGGIGFAGALTLLFIGLKLGHVINWSWWWVLAPSWAPLAAFVVLAVFGIPVAMAVSAAKKRKGAQR